MRGRLPRARLRASRSRVVGSMSRLDSRFTPMYTDLIGKGSMRGSTPRSVDFPAPSAPIRATVKLPPSILSLALVLRFSDTSLGPQLRRASDLRLVAEAPQSFGQNLVEKL